MYLGFLCRSFRFRRYKTKSQIEDTKGVIKIRKLNDRQCNSQNKKVKKTIQSWLGAIFNVLCYKIPAIGHYIMFFSCDALK